MAVHGLLQHDIDHLPQIRRQRRPAKGEDYDDQPNGPQHTQKPETGIRLWNIGFLIHPPQSRPIVAQPYHRQWRLAQAILQVTCVLLGSEAPDFLIRQVLRGLDILVPHPHAFC